MAQPDDKESVAPKLGMDARDFDLVGGESAVKFANVAEATRKHGAQQGCRLSDGYPPAERTAGL